jgi:hypothetical protein
MLDPSQFLKTIYQLLGTLTTGTIGRTLKGIERKAKVNVPLNVGEQV